VAIRHFTTEVRPYIHGSSSDLRYPIMVRTDDFCAPAKPIHAGRHDFGAPNGCWRARGIPEHLVMYTYAGEARIGWPGGEVRSTAGCIDLIAPRVAHDYGRAPDAERWGVLWVVFRAPPDWLDWLDWPEAAPGIMHMRLADPALRRQIEARLDEARTLSEGSLPNRDLLAMNALEAALLWCWNQARGEARLDQRLKRAVAWMCERLGQPQDVAQAARAAGVSAPHFARLFRRHLGTSPQRWLEERRIERACALLRATPLAVGEIAEQTGFASPFYFATRFRNRVGRSPSAYRAAAAAGKL
jgi:AraC family transcriptional regulator of arabinose operon